MVLETIPRPDDFDVVAGALRRLRDDRLQLNIGPYDLRATAARVGLVEELLEDLEVRRDMADARAWTVTQGEVGS